MYSALLTNTRLQASLWQLDQELAVTVQQAGCPCCGAALHSARYPRKLRGTAPEWRSHLYWRRSFCCSAEGCRRRTTPPSVYFLGRKVYLATAVVLASAMRCGATPASMQRISELLGVSRRTVLRWQAWWRHRIPESPFWCANSGSFVPPVTTFDLPLSLLDRFAGDLEHRLIALLRFLAPLSGGNGLQHAM
jgi:Homeodomain-like domain